jgi:hypothetical protein
VLLQIKLSVAVVSVSVVVPTNRKIAAKFVALILPHHNLAEAGLFVG